MLKKNKNKIIKIFFGTIIALTPFFGAEAISLRPQLIEFRTSPGILTEHKVKITNDEKNTLCVALETENISSMSPTGAPIYQITENIGLAEWISLAEKSICLLPQETKEVRLAITIPATASLSGYYAAAFFTPTSTPQQSNGAALINRVGILIAARIDTSKTIEQGMISKFAYDDEAKNFIIEFKNEGNVHLRPYGEITLKNKKDEIILTSQVNTDGLLVLPGSTRHFVIPLQKQLFGQIEAEVNLFYGTGPKSAVAKITISFPEIKNKNFYWAIILPLAVLLIFIIRFSLRRLRKFGTYV